MFLIAIMTFRWGITFQRIPVRKRQPPPRLHAAPGAPFELGPSTRVCGGHLGGLCGAALVAERCQSAGGGAAAGGQGDLPRRSLGVVWAGGLSGLGWGFAGKTDGKNEEGFWGLVLLPCRNRVFEGGGLGEGLRWFEVSRIGC